MKVGNKILVIDGNNIAHRALHAMGGMQFGGRPTGVIFGFLNVLGSNISQFKPKKVYICWDGSSNKQRLNLLLGYRRRDPKIGVDREALERQMNTLRIMMKSLGIPQLHAPYHEADDFIYGLTRKHEGENLIITSGDKDFRQLVTKKVWVFDERKGLITPLNFKRLFNLEPEQYADYLCLDGDESDKIPGCPGVGPVTALKILHEYGSVENYLATAPNGNDKYDGIDRVFPINRTLINLSAFEEAFGKIELQYYKGLEKPKKRIEKYIALCKKYGINKWRTPEFINKIP